jgi:hypothetical protein
MKILLLQNRMDSLADKAFLASQQTIFLKGKYQSNEVQKQFEHIKNNPPDGLIVPGNFYFYDFLEFNSLKDVQRTFYVYQGNQTIEVIAPKLAKAIWEDIENLCRVSEILRFKQLI